MPIHDWTRVPSGLFHHFHQDWTVEIARALNRGSLPAGYYAFVEQRVGGPEPDVVAVETGRGGRPGGAVLATPPRTRLVTRLESEAAAYANKANRVAIRHQLGDVVALIEVVSPGNKDGRDAFRTFVQKAVGFLRSGVHLLIVDLFPPSARDPHGIHKAIADEFLDQPFERPADKPLTLAAYAAGYPLTAYVEPVAVGDALPDMALFLTHDEYVNVPLEATYRATWDGCPEPIRELLEQPPRPEPT